MTARALLPLIFLAAVGCTAPPPHIHLVLPNGYEGAFAVYVNHPQGISMRATEGRYVCRVPETGILKVKGEEPFYLTTWPTRTAAFADGTAIPLGGDDPTIKNDTVALWTLFTQKDKSIWYFIGPREKMRVALKMYESPRPGGVVVKESKESDGGIENP